MQAPLQEASLTHQKIKAYFKMAQENENVWNAALVFLGALFILSAIPFFPLFLVPILAIICAIPAYFEKAYVGTLLSVLLALLAFSYQSAALGFVFILIVALTLFEMFSKWAVISALQILIFAPFAPFPLSLFSPFVMLGMVIAALHFGSKRSLMISIPSVLLVLLLSSMWLVPNNAFFHLNFDYYTAVELMQVSGEPSSFGDLPTNFSYAISNLFDFEKFTGFAEALGILSNNFALILFKDTGIIQMATWAVTLFVIVFLSGAIKKRPQFFSSLFMFFVPLVYYLLSESFNYPFDYAMLVYIALSVLIVGALEQYNISFSRESHIKRSEKAKKFGKFGIEDLSFSKGAESLSDVGGYEDVKHELTESILVPLENKELSYTYGLKPPSGILLFGPPGTGKTMLMRALAKEIKYGFYYVKSADILSKWYGESERNLMEMFDTARKNAPCILFFDEIDSVGKKREEFSNDDVGPRILSAFLQELDGFKTGKTVITVGATNVPNKLDPALLRPGRFDKIIYMSLPDLEGRKKIFEVHLRKKGLPVAGDINYAELAKKSERFSGADIKNAVSEAIRIAAREASEKGKVVPITHAHLIGVVKKLKPSVSLAALDSFEQFKLDFERRVGKVELKEEEKEKTVKWEDVAGLGDVKKALLEAIELPLLHEDLVQKFKVKPTKGILLFGPPGTGKTLIVKAASNELKSSFVFLSGAELMKKGFGNAVTVLRENFNRARENTPSILFIDEIESIAPSRSYSPSELVGQLLNEMDGMKTASGVVVVAATNKPSMLDVAILRPGRFDKIFYIGPPDKGAREEIFKINLGEFAENLNAGSFASITDGFSGADIASVCQEVKMVLLRDKLSGKEPKPSDGAVIEIIKKRRPSITKDSMGEYNEFLAEYGERR